MNAFPEHVAIIMDGNGRWATERKKPRVFGHHAGAKVAEQVVQYALADGIKTLTLFVFGQDNMTRPLDEVSFLFQLIESQLIKLKKDLVHQGVALKVLGDLTRLPSSTQEVIGDVVEKTASGQALQLNILVNYSGQWHITQVVQGLLKKVHADALSVDAIDQHDLDDILCQDLSPPDLLIRSSGERRLSNFMLWQLAYTELLFLPVLWPDFSQSHWDQALMDFQKRERRFGRIKGKT